MNSRYTFEFENVVQIGSADAPRVKVEISNLWLNSDNMIYAEALANSLVNTKDLIMVSKSAERFK